MAVRVRDSKRHGAPAMLSPATSPESPADSVASDEEDDETQATTISLSASITDYPVEFGRTYHRYREGSYLYPNDEQEVDRLDMQHHMLRRVYGGRLHQAPIHNPKRILDVGTGTGIWPVEMASLFPNSVIYGTDLSPIQPDSVPQNVHFVIDDATETDWLWPHSHFDYIHTGVMLGSLPSFSRLIRTARKYLRPGTGWFECHDFYPTPFCDDGSAPPDYALRAWESSLEHSARRVDPPRPLRIADQYKKWMLDAGFVDVHERIEKIPINPWPKDPRLKEIGQYNEANWLDGLAAFSYKLFGPKGLGWNKDEIEVFLIAVRKSIQNRHIHAYQRHYTVWGRRPSAEEENALLRVGEKERAKRGK